MPPKRKVNDFADFENRLSVLEGLLKAKDAEIAELKVTTADLRAKLDLQEAAIANLQSPLEDDSPPTPAITAKLDKDLLVIGDSLVREIDGAVINPDGDTTVTCLPGAQPDDITTKFCELSKTISFKRIVVHTGTNLIPKYSPAFAADKILQCMDTIRELSPSSKLAYSHILPKQGKHLNPGINFINNHVTSSGQSGPSRTRFGFASHHRYFSNSFGQVNGKLFKRDGIHLSASGVEQFNNSIKDLISKQ